MTTHSLSCSSCHHSWLMVCTTLWTCPCIIILISRVLTHSCCAFGVLETKQDDPGPPDSTRSKGATAAAAGGSRFSTTGQATTQLKGAEEVAAAARRCVALDDSGRLPANRALGLFETDDEADRVGAPRTTTTTTAVAVASASVKFIAQPLQRSEGGGDGSTATSATGTVRINMQLEVDDEYSALLLGSGTAAPAHDSGSGSGCGSKSAPTREDVEKAAAAAAEIVAEDPAETPVAISALAAWNLATTDGVVNDGGAGAAGTAMAIRVEIAAAFGYYGDWYTASKDVTLVGDGHGNNSGGGGNVVSLSTSFDWQPTGDVWANLDEPVVADVKVYSSAPSATAHSRLPVAEAAVGSTSVQNQEEEEGEEELVLLQATLCKRSTSMGIGSRASRGGNMATGAATAAPAVMQATLMHYAERIEHDLPQQHDKGERVTPPVTAGSSAPAPAAAAGSSRPVFVVSEIEDEEWWKTHEEKAYGRGMDAVNGLPRLRGWKPGDWKKRRKRRRRQDEERERRRSEEAAHRRATRRGGDSSADGGRSAWGALKGAWRAIGRKWRRSVRQFRRGKK